MPIPVNKTPLEYYNDQISTLVKLRDKFLNYFEDWATLPVGVKNGVKARFSSDVTTVKTALDDINTAVQNL